MKIILINGKARSGKDTLASLIRGILGHRKVLIRPNAYSVKECALKYFSWNGAKDTKGRQLLIDITNLGLNLNKIEVEYSNLDMIENLEFNIDNYTYKESL